MTSSPLAPLAPLPGPPPTGSACLPVGTAGTCDLEWQAQTTAAILELVGKVGSSADLEGGCHVLAAEVGQYLGCQRVAVGLLPQGSGPTRLYALSGMADLDPRGEVPRAILAALDESIERNSLTAWPPLADAQRHATSAHRKLSQLAGAAAVVSSPLVTLDGTVVGAWVFLTSSQFAQNQATHRFLEASSPSVGTCLDLLRRAEPNPCSRWLKKVVRPAHLWRRKALWIVLTTCVTALFLPVPYKVGCDCQIEPVTRRFVAAPHAGVFEKSLVKPGDLVARGQVLGRMDGREVRWEVAGLAADRNRAGKARDVNLATSKVAAAQMDRLEIERLDLKRRLLTHRAEHLDIKSPLDGIVISGDLERSEGVPLSVGQPLFEIAPLDRMLAEVAIPDEEISHVRAGQAVRIRLDAYPGRVWTGRLARVQPRSEIRESENVFLGEVVLDNHELVLRPGMKGSAKVTSSRRALGWIIFRKPWEHLAAWLRW